MVLQRVPQQFPLLAITMTRGLARKTPEVREALRLLGLRRPYQTVYQRNNAATRGIVRRAIKCIRVTETAGEIPGTVY